MAVNVVYSQNIQGSVIMTGNTIQLYDQLYTVGLPTCIPPSGGTTTSWPNSSTSASITIPNSSIVKKAYLSWAGYYFSSGTGLDIPTAPTLTTTLIDPTSIAHTINPQNTQTYTDIGGNKLFTQMVDVTTIVATAGSGFYTVGPIPVVLDAQGSSGGFILYVVYEDKNEPVRNITVWSMIEGCQVSNVAVDVPLSGFSTPSSGTVNGKMIFSVVNGDTVLVGDYAAFGKDTSSLQLLYGPNNPSDNFFCSQINDNDGYLDKSGTWGTYNSTIGALPNENDRFRWDVTRVSANPGLTNNQTSGILRLYTINDGYFVMSLALQIDNAPFDTPIKTVDKDYATINDVLTYTVTIANNGNTDVENVVFFDTIPNATTFINNSLVVNGVTLPGENPNPPTGASIGTIPSGSVSTIVFKVTVNTIPSPNSIPNTASLIGDYILDPVLGTTISVGGDTNTVVSQVYFADLGNILKFTSKQFGTCGDIITYTISIPNTGNVDAFNVVLSDTVPNGTIYVPNSIAVNGNPIGGTPDSINVGTVPAGNTVVVTFQVQINC